MSAANMLKKKASRPDRAIWGEESRRTTGKGIDRMKRTPTVYGGGSGKYRASETGGHARAQKRIKFQRNDPERSENAGEPINVP